MARKIVITSGKGGVGKSTICLMLGKQLSLNGARVVMLDVDVGLHNLDVVAGITSKIDFDVVDVLEGKVRISQALIQDENIPTLFYLPSSHAYNVGKVSPKMLSQIVNQLSGFDYVLLDCPAGIDFGFHSAVFCASEALIVTTPNLIDINTADKVATLLCHYDVNGVGLVVNKIPKGLFKKRGVSAMQIANVLKLPLVGSFYESALIKRNALTTGAITQIEPHFKKSIIHLANNVFFGNYKN